MRKLGLSKRRKFYQKSIGKKHPVLVESQRGGTDSLLKGISSNYLPVLLDGGDELKNKVVDVRVERLEGNRLFGALVTG